MPAYSRVRYVAGHLLFVRQGKLIGTAVQRHDGFARRANPSRSPIESSITTPATRPSTFPTTGVLVYNRSAGEPTTKLMVFDGRGRELEPLAPAGHFRHPRFSPDGQRVVAEKVNDADGNVDLWMYDLSRGSRDAPDQQRRTGCPADVVTGRTACGVLVKARRPLRRLHERVDTTAVEQPLVTAPGDKFVDQWSPDGKYLSGTVLRSGLWIFPLESIGETLDGPRRSEG